MHELEVYMYAVRVRVRIVTLSAAERRSSMSASVSPPEALYFFASIIALWNTCSSVKHRIYHARVLSWTD